MRMSMAWHWGMACLYDFTSTQQHSTQLYLDAAVPQSEHSAQHSTAPTLTVNDAHHDNDDNRQPTTAKSKLRLRPPPPASKHPSKHPSTGKWQPLSTRTGLRRPKPAKLLPPPLPSPRLQS